MLERLANKVGPLPVWAWGAILGAVIIAYLYFTNWRGASAAPATGDNEDAPARPSASGGATAWDFYHGAGGGTTEPISTGPEPIASNLQWLAQAVRVAVSKGYPAATAQVALQRFISGESLTESQQAIINAVIPVIGPPPEGTDFINELVPDPAKHATPTKIRRPTTAATPTTTPAVARQHEIPVTTPQYL